MTLPEQRIAFYPCCASDFRWPMIILSPYADRIIYNDIDKSRRDRFDKFLAQKEKIVPVAEFFLEDAYELVQRLERIDVLFCRCDGVGEGGSGVMVLGDRFLGLVMDKMPAEGGLIITDGSNSQQDNFELMTRPQGVSKFGRNLFPHLNKPIFSPLDQRSFQENKMLSVIVVGPL